MFKVSTMTMTMTMTMTFSSFVFRSSSFQVFKFQVPNPRRHWILHSSLFTFRTANKVQGERRAELARAMLSRSLYSLLQLVCESKVTKNLRRKYQL